MKKILMFITITIAVTVFSFRFFWYVDTVNGLGISFGGNPWKVFVGYPFIGGELNFNLGFIGFRGNGGLSVNASAFTGELSVNLPVRSYVLFGGAHIGYDSSLIDIEENEDKIVGAMTLVGGIEYYHNVSYEDIYFYNYDKYFKFYAKVFYPVMDYQYVGENEIIPLSPPYITSFIPVDILVGVEFGMEYEKWGASVYINSSRIPYYYTAPVINHGLLGIIRIYIKIPFSS